MIRSLRGAVPPEGQPPHRWQVFAVCPFLLLAVWAVFGQTRHFQFVNFDDDVYVYDNPAISQGFSWHGVIGAFKSVNGAGEWLPLTALSRMLDCQLYGLHPGGHHLTNVILHAATACLLFLVLGNMTNAFWPAAFVAALFAIHPLRVESVAWVTERKDVLSGLFFMLALLAYVRYAHKQSSVGNNSLTLDPRRWTLDYFMALIFFALGLMSKPMLVTLPFVLLLLDYWPLNRLTSLCFGTRHPLLHAWLGLFFEKMPFLLLSAAVCMVTVLTQRHAIGSVQTFDLPARIANALVSYVVYLQQMLDPVGLAAFYPYPQNHLWSGKVGFSLLILLLLSAGAVVERRKYPFLLVGWLWYLGMLVPVIGLLQVGDQARADRYTYLPQIGLYILVVWGATNWCGAWRRRCWMLGFAATAILGALLVGAHVQAGYWKDSVSLWTHTLSCTSGNYVAHNNLGMALAGQGRRTEAIGQYEQALQIEPDYAKAHNNLGVALADRGRWPEATEHYLRALQLKPDDAQIHNNLGIALAGEGRLTDAVEEYERALQLKPDYAEAHNNLGVALASQGRWSEAIEHCEQALRLNPDFAQAYYNLGNALAARNQLGEAVEQYEQALRLEPDYAAAHNNLGLALATQGRLMEAIEHYERVIQLRPDAAEPYYNLGNALVSQGKPAAAIPRYQQALTLASGQGNAALAESIRTRLKSCQSARPQP